MFKNTSAFRLWIISILLFWGGTVIVTFIDYAGEQWFNTIWTRGPDLFPNSFLGFPLLFVQLISGVILIASVVKVFSEKKRSFILAFISILITGAVSIFAFALFSYWYQAGFMGRSM